MEPALTLAEAKLPASAPLPEPLPSWRPRLLLRVYRDRHHRVGFMELNAMTARLLQRLAPHAGASVAQLPTLLADELRDSDRPDILY